MNLFPLFCLTNPPLAPISDLEYRLFYTTDRRLFSTLIHNLVHNPDQSINVMAFLMWLDGSDLKSTASTIHKVVDWPGHLLDQLANQIMTILKCVHNQTFCWVRDFDISLLLKLCKPRLSPLIFHQNREDILTGMAKAKNDVYMRAFGDLYPGQIFEGNSNGVINQSPTNFLHNQSKFLTNVQISSEVGNVNNNGGRTMYPQQDGAGSLGAYSNDITLRLSGMNLDNVRHEEINISAEERTIFLTFSRGFPISEYEIRDFFTRNFGDFIERIHMQEHVSGEQALFARMVVRNPSIIPLIAGDSNTKIKYIINGKHLRARKFVKMIHLATTSYTPHQSATTSSTIGY